MSVTTPETTPTRRGRPPRISPVPMPTPPKRVASVPDDETPNQRFHRLAVARVNKVLKAMKGVSRLSSGRYKWTEVQAASVVYAIQAEADRIRGAFYRQDNDTPFEL